MQNLFLMETVRKNIKAKAVLKNILMKWRNFWIKTLQTLHLHGLNQELNQE